MISYRSNGMMMRSPGDVSKLKFHKIFYPSIFPWNSRLPKRESCFSRRERKRGRSNKHLKLIFILSWTTETNGISLREEENLSLSSKFCGSWSPQPSREEDDFENYFNFSFSLSLPHCLYLLSGSLLQQIFFLFFKRKMGSPVIIGLLLLYLRRRGHAVCRYHYFHSVMQLQERVYDLNQEYPQFPHNIVLTKKVSSSFLPQSFFGNFSH